MIGMLWRLLVEKYTKTLDKRLNIVYTIDVIIIRKEIIYSMSKTSHSSGMLSDLDQGDIIWLDFSPSVGHEQADYRPSLVISKQEFNKQGLVIVLPITRTPGPMKEEINCLPEKSYVMCDQPRTLDLRERKYDFDNDCYLLKSELVKILGRFKAIFL